MNQHYALVNPLSRIVDKPREDFTREDLIRVIEEQQIERITFHYTALDGKLKELKLPIVNRSHHYPKAVSNPLASSFRTENCMNGTIFSRPV